MQQLQFLLRCLECIGGVHSLFLLCPDDMYTMEIGEEDIISKLGQKVKYFFLHHRLLMKLPKIPCLHALELSRCSSFPITGLSLPSFKGLRCLKLSSCSSITDVSCLDYVYDLSLCSLNGIRDISCLNHNHKITVINCSNIRDYSKSFKFSYFICIEYGSSSYLALESSRLIHVRQLIVVNPVFPKDMNILTSAIIIRSLQFLTITQFQHSFTLPENCLKELNISRCGQFLSCANMGTIRIVRLNDIPLSSLEGLGERNQIIEITDCPELVDFSCLRKCKKVLIRGCPGFSDATQVLGIPELEVCPSSSMFSLNGITTLLLSENDYLTIASLIESSNTIHTIKFLPDFERHFIDCFLLVCRRTRIKKIIVRSQVFINTNENEFLQKQLKDNFLVERPFQSLETVLLRKINH